jgi:hypothetical protein
MKTLAAAIILFVLVGCNSKKPDEPNEAAQTEKNQQMKARVQEFSSHYNAVTDWAETLSELSPYTVEVQDALIRADSRPVLVLGTVEDVAKESDKYVVRFSNLLNSVFVEELDNLLYLTDIYFVLDCTPEQVKKIMLHRQVSLSGDCAVIAEISQIKKVEFQLKGYLEDYDSEGYPEVRIDLEPSSNAFIAKGKCIDLLFLGE